MLDGRFRFDNFVVGVSNRLAASAAGAVADTPGAVYNPLVVYAAPGMGKTHLLSALGYAIRQSGRGRVVEYVALATLLEEMRSTDAPGGVEQLMRRYHECDVLLLDDVQLLTGHHEAQGEVLRLVEAMQSTRRQIVISCDRPPLELIDVDQRLRARMAGGLIVDIGLPEHETRLAILNRKCADRRLTLAASVLEELARMPARNIRELQAALNRVLAEQVMKDAPLDVADVKTVVTQRRPEPTPPRDEYESFVSEIAATLSESVEQWRTRLSETIARWAAQGFSVAVLQRALHGDTAPDLAALEAQFAADAEQLRALEAEAVRLDGALAGSAVFRDPERLREAEILVSRAIAAYDPPPGPDPRFTIDAFVIGERNQLALRAAMDIVAAPGARYNPLYVYGPAGSGKTHLAHAIGNALVRQSAASAIACVNAARFSADLAEALEYETTVRWRLRYRAAEAFIIDDVHALAGHEHAQKELLLLLDAMQAAGKQIVLTADVQPSHLSVIDPGFRSRFESGLVVEVGHVPDAERVARRTPVPDGAEAAAPTIDAWFEEQIEPEAAALVHATESTGSIDTFFLDPEKVIAEWPGVEGRVLEDLR